MACPRGGAARGRRKPQPRGGGRTRSRISMFSGAGLLESAGEKTRRPEAFAFFDARARDAAVVGRSPGEDLPQTEPSESLCPHLAQCPSLRSSSPLSSWPWSVRTSALASASLRTQPSSPTAPRRPGAAAVSAAPGGPAAHPRSRLRQACRLGGGGRPARGLGEERGRAGPGGRGGVRAEAGAGRRAGGVAAAAPLFSAGRRSGQRRRGPHGAGARWGHERVWTSAGRGVWPASRAPAPPCPGAVLNEVAG